MTTISVKTDIRAAVKKLNDLAAGAGDRALRQAVNKTAAKGRTEAVREISREYALEQKEIRPQVSVRMAKTGKVVAMIETFPKRRGHRSRNVMVFGAKQEARGVSVKIRRGEARKLIRSAWIGNEGRTVFTRVGKARYPIRGVETIDIPSMFMSRRVIAKIVARIEKELPIEFDRAARLAIARLHAR